MKNYRLGVTLSMRGIQELKNALVNLPRELKAESTKIVLDTANAAAAEIRAAYPIGPPRKKYAGGNLRRGVKVRVEELGPVGVAAEVRSAAPHAHLWEFGTEARHYISKRGRRHDTGIMHSKTPAAPVFIPTMQRYRRAMYLELGGLLQAHGLLVRWSA